MTITKLRILKSLNILFNYLRFETGYYLGNDYLKPVTPKQAFRLWIKKLHKQKLPPVEGRVLITALRNHVWIEWALYCACNIRKLGFQSTIIFDQQLIDKSYPKKWYEKNIEKIVKNIDGLEWIDISALEVNCDRKEHWQNLAVEWSKVAIAYDIHAEEADITSSVPEHKGLLEKYIIRTTTIASGLDVFLKDRVFERCICYSGIIGESKLILDVLLDHKVYTACVEGWGWRAGHMIYNFNAAALEYNTLGWIKAQGEWDNQKEKEIKQFLKFIDEDEQSEEWLTNYYRVQKSAISKALPEKIRLFIDDGKPVFLLAPNVIGDSSTLKRETIFSGQKNWIKETIEWFSKRPDIKLIIRAHPAEPWMGGKCTQHIGQIAATWANGAPNILIINATEELNTFSLVPFMRAGLAWLSSAAVDFVVRGVPASVAAKPKYAGLGIVKEPATKVDYFNSIEQWAKEGESVTSSQINAGKRYLHMVFKGFSFEAQGRTYRAMSCNLDEMPSQQEHDRFYKILVGKEKAPDLN